MRHTSVGLSIITKKISRDQSQSVCSCNPAAQQSTLDVFVIISGYLETGVGLIHYSLIHEID